MSAIAMSKITLLAAGGVEEVGVGAGVLDIGLAGVAAGVLVEGVGVGAGGEVGFVVATGVAVGCVLSC